MDRHLQSIKEATINDVTFTGICRYKLPLATADAVINACAQVFVTHEISAKLCSDNGPPFNSKSFRTFMAHFRIRHVTSRSYYPRGNGMAERAVQEVEKLLKKCPFSTLAFFSAFLEWRNTPRDDRLKSSAQRLMRRHSRTQLPVTNYHLKPRTVPPEEVRQRLKEIRHMQCVYYNRGTRCLPELESGSRVSVYETRSKTWAPAVVVGPAGTARSYVVSTESRQQLRRTREHLRTTETDTHESQAISEPVTHIPEDNTTSTRTKTKVSTTREGSEGALSGCWNLESQLALEQQIPAAASTSEIQD
ncbi:uncharacterized protein LOC144160693 [Haemaphysalis longicornis]